MTGPDPSSSRRTVLRAVAVLVFWTLVGLASAVQAHVGATLEGQPVSAWTSALRSVPVWWYWVPVTPAIAWLARRFRIERGMLARAIGVHVVAAVAATLLHAGWLILVFQWSGVFAGMTGTMGEMFRILALSRFYLDLLTYFAILGGAYAFDYHDRLGERELRASRLETQLARARLDALRMQLNPHFLFNALHAVTAQVRAGRGAAAVTMLGGLGDLLRYALDTDGEPLVPLWRELAFLDRYLDIERVRFADRLRVEVNVAAEVREGWVPPLLLQPLVENAVRHGIAPREGPGRIEVAAERVDDRLALTVRDDGVGLSAGSAPGSGVGLANARARLAELYGDGWDLEVAERAGGGVEVRVTIPWRPGPR